MTNPAAAFRALPPGTRVVIRYRIQGGATDVIGELIQWSDETCEVRTRAGDVRVILASIVAAKAVPPPPVRRTGR